MSATPKPKLLDTERLDELKTRQLTADATHVGLVAYRYKDDVGDLLAHIAARDVLITEAFTQLLDEGYHPTGPRFTDFKRGINQERRSNNKLVRAMAAAINIILPDPK